MSRISKSLGSFVVVLGLFGGCTKSISTKTGETKEVARKETPLIEMVREHAVLALPVNGFDQLSIRDKLLAYHLYQAAVTGRDIYFDQKHPQSLAVKNL